MKRIRVDDGHLNCDSSSDIFNMQDEYSRDVDSDI